MRYTQSKFKRMYDSIGPAVDRIFDDCIARMDEITEQKPKDGAAATNKPPFDWKSCGGPCSTPYIEWIGGGGDGGLLIDGATINKRDYAYWSRHMWGRLDD